MRKLRLIVPIVMLASLVGILLVVRVPKSVAHENSRAHRPGTDEYAVAYYFPPPEFRNGVPFIYLKPVHWRAEVCLEGPRERACRQRGPVVWRSVDVSVDALTWLSRDSLRVDVPHIIYPTRHRESVRTHRHRGVVVTTEGLTARTE